MRLEPPTSGLVKRGVEDFNADEGAQADKAIEQLIRAFPNNSKFEHVILKVAVISRLYNAPLYAAPVSIARHICGLDLDTNLAIASTEIVNAIAAVPSVPRRLYSFATKYCGWHRPEAYPLYDSYVRRALIAYRDQYHFRKFDARALEDYGDYKSIVQAFRAAYQLEGYSFKELDKFLWLVGKNLTGIKARRLSPP